jgi:MAternally affected uncoordination
VYLRSKRENELRQVLEQVSTENSQFLNSQALMGSFYYVQGLNAFHKSSFHEAK